MTELTDENFYLTTKTGDWLVLCYTSWCPHCPAASDILEELESGELGGLRYAKLDFEKCPDSVKQLSIPGVPTVFAQKSGQTAEMLPGLRERECYEQLRDSLAAYPFA